MIPVFFLAYPAQARLRATTAAAGCPPARAAGPADRRHPHHQLLRAGRAAHPGVGRGLGRDPAPDPAGHRARHIPLAIIVRITRASVLEVLNEDYVRTAEAKGLAPVDDHRGGTCCATPCCRWSPRSACRPGLLLAGAVLTETVFAFNGIGPYLFEAISQRRLSPCCRASSCSSRSSTPLVNLLVDLSYGVIDPRVRVR